MLDARQLVLYVIRPSLKSMGLYSKAAEQLVLGTGLVESNLTYLVQKGSGIAKGIYQMEVATHDDLWITTLAAKKELRLKVESYLAQVAVDSKYKWKQLIANLDYATMMCRVHYYRIKAALPKEGDIEGMAAYWKKYYNTVHGAGKEEHFLKYKDIIINATKE